MQHQKPLATLAQWHSTVLACKLLISFQAITSELAHVHVLLQSTTSCNIHLSHDHIQQGMEDAETVFIVTDLMIGVHLLDVLVFPKWQKAGVL